MRAAILLLLCAGPLAAAPAPFPRTRPGTAQAIVTAPGGDVYQAAQAMRDLAFLRSVFEHAPYVGDARGKTADWVRERLRVEPVRGGAALRITLADCPENDALALLHLIVQRHLYDRIPARNQVADYLRKITNGPNGNVRKGGDSLTFLPERDRRTVMEYLRKRTRKEEDAIVLRQPTLAR